MNNSIIKGIKGKFLRFSHVLYVRNGVIALCALQFLLLPEVAASQTVVTGWNDPAVDVPAVQAAVDQGGSVLLVGTFNFGDTGRVLLRNDVEVSGEADNAGNPLTKIVGGDWPLYSPLPPTACPRDPADPPLPSGPRVTVKYIHFEGAKGIAVHLAYTGGASIHHNKVTAMRDRLITSTTYRRSAVFIGPFDSRARTCLDITPRLVSGPIEVFDNYLDSTETEPSTSTNAGAVFMAFLNGADVRIENNISIGCTRNCIAVFDAIPDATGRGSLVVANNTVVSNVTVGFTAGVGPRAPIGIDATFTFNRAGDFADHITALIADNYIELNGRSSMGIISGYPGAVVVGNAVVVHADAAATTAPHTNSTTGGFLIATSRQVVLRNRVAGEGSHAIRIGGNTPGLARIDNVVQANNISGFKAFISDFFLDFASASNTIVGNSGTVIDNGTDNKTTGLKPVTGGVGGDVSDAEQYWHDVTEELE